MFYISMRLKHSFLILSTIGFNIKSLNFHQHQRMMKKMIKRKRREKENQQKRSELTASYQFCLAIVQMNPHIYSVYRHSPSLLLLLDSSSFLLVKCEYALNTSKSLFLKSKKTISIVFRDCPWRGTCLIKGQ